MGKHCSEPWTAETLAADATSQLEKCGIYIKTDAFDSEQIQKWAEAHRELEKQSNFRVAAIGHEGDRTVETQIRRDKTLWIDPLQKFHQDLFDQVLTTMEAIRVSMNENLQLGLWDFEVHLAKYDEGDFYKTHLDSFQKNNRRKLTFILYLNPVWTPGHGGELIVYAPRTPDSDLQYPLSFPIKIEPKGGTLVIFLSELFPHEVLTSRFERRSIAGWFRCRQ